MPTRRNTVEDFWAQVNRTDGCWLWTGRCDAHGYGRFSYIAPEGRIQVASHMAWYLSHGELPPSPCLLHYCDNPPCVRPDHLSPGTRRDNNLDRTVKGRGSRGMRQGAAKLTDDGVRSARALHAAGWSYSRLARQFGVSHTTMTDAVSGRAWTHVT